MKPFTRNGFNFKLALDIWDTETGMKSAIRAIHEIDIARWGLVWASGIGVR